MTEPKAPVDPKVAAATDATHQDAGEGPIVRSIGDLVLRTIQLRRYAGPALILIPEGEEDKPINGSQVVLVPDQRLRIVPLAATTPTEDTKTHSLIGVIYESGRKPRKGVGKHLQRKPAKAGDSMVGDEREFAPAAGQDDVVRIAEDDDDDVEQGTPQLTHLVRLRLEDRTFPGWRQFVAALLDQQERGVGRRPTGPSPLHAHAWSFRIHPANQRLARPTIAASVGGAEALDGELMEDAARLAEAVERALGSEG